MNKAQHLISEAQRAEASPNGILRGSDREGWFQVSQIEINAWSPDVITITGHWRTAGCEFNGVGAIDIGSCDALAAWTA